MWESGMSGAGFWWLFPIMFVAICLFMMFGIRRSGMGCMPMGHGSHESGHEKKEDPADIAKERYAKGEIDRDEFKRIMDDLEKKVPQRT